MASQSLFDSLSNNAQKTTKEGKGKMRTNTRKFGLALTWLALVAILVMAAGTVGADQNDHPVASPFDADPMSKAATEGSSLLGVRLTAVGDPVDMDAALVAGADYLKHAQADVTEDNAGNGETPDSDPDDGGWDWVLTYPDFTHSASASPKNIYGATAMGLYYAYLETGDPTYMTAMQDAATYMIGDAGIRSAADLVFLMRFQDLTGVTADVYKDAAKAKFDGRIAYYGSATALAQYIRTVRCASYPNGIIAWDIGAWAVAAQMLADRYPGDSYNYATAADDIAEVIYQDSFNDNPGCFDIVDDAGWDYAGSNANYWWYTLGISGLIDAFESANVHTDEIPGLVTTLLNCQYPGGAFSYCYGANVDDEDWQSTAYAVMSLARVSQTTYQTEINHAAYWLGATQDAASGGWVYSSGNHYPEVSGECTAALSFGQNASEVWVDDDYTSSSCGGHLWGYDAFDNIQDGIDAVEGSTVNVAAGTYTEAILIDKPLTLSGATAGVNKNGYTVPAGYAWDDTVESIINHPNPSGGYITIVDIVDTDDVTFEGFVVQELNAVGNLNSSLVRVYAYTREISNIVVRNNVIGPNTNTTAQDGAQGRMGLYIVNHPYDDNGVVDSTFSGNKIFDCKGNGDNVFLWSSYASYSAPGPASMSGTVIEDNEIYGSHRSGIETAGGFSGLTIRDNSIYGNGGPGTPDLKYGTGILMIRGSGDKTDCNGYGPVDVTIEDNEIYDNEDHGIYMGPNNQDVTITGNDIHDNGEDAVRVDLIGNYWNPDFDPNPGPYTCLGGSQNVSASSNSIENNGAGVQVIGTPTNSFVLDAKNNWWGAASGPSGEGAGSGDAVSTFVVYSPWWANETGTATGTEMTTTDHATVQDAIDGASSGDVIVLAEGTHTGGFTVDTPGITILGHDGTVIYGGSEAFKITEADVILKNLVIDGQSIHSGDPAILVTYDADSRGDNLTVQNCEIKGGWADGIQVATSVTSFKVIGNWIHGNVDGLQVDVVTIGGVVTIEGNLFKDNTGKGVNNDSATTTLPAEYNSWGCLGTPIAYVEGSVTYDPWTFVEVFMDMKPETEAVTVAVNESKTFDVKLKVDAKSLLGLTFKVTYDTDFLTWKSTTWATAFDGNCTALTGNDPSGGVLYYRCTLDPALDTDGGDVFTLNFTAEDSDASESGNDGPWTQYFDVSHEETYTSAGAAGGVKIYVNNAGYGAPSITDRVITDTDDGEVTITGIAQYTGFVDLQGRANDSGAAIEVYNQAAKASVTKLASATSSAGGGYTTSYISPNLLTIGTTYYLLVDRALYLPTTAAAATVYAQSRGLDTRPLTTLLNVKLLGGDATNDNVIAVTDATCIGGDYSKTSGFTECGGAGSGGTSDVNGDNVVDILDLVLMGGNYDLTFSPWTP